MMSMEQSQFLEILDRDEAERRFHAALDLVPLAAETVPLDEALGRTLAESTTAPADVPGFTRSNVDGFAVRAADTFGCGEETPQTLRLNDEILDPGTAPTRTVTAGTATCIATGGVLPRGADAVIMVEHTVPAGEGAIEIRRALAPGAHLSHAGSDIARGETVLRRGTLLTSRETGVLAALGRDQVQVVRQPLVAILSTGNEVVPPGQPLALGQVYDANSTVLAGAVRELGCLPRFMGIIPDDEPQLEAALARGLREADVVLLSGGTSKGGGDLNAHVVARLTHPGILVHGVALKPGKPICLAVHGRKPVVILPGFPTSMVFTFHEFVAPVLRAMAGQPPLRRRQVRAILPQRFNSEIGRTEYTLVSLVQPMPAAVDPGKKPVTDAPPIAVPLGKGSGSVTAFGSADGFLTIPRQDEYLPAGEPVQITLLGRDLQPADLLLQGSHCLGLDPVLDDVRRRGFTARALSVGSSAGLAAVLAGHADLAGIHIYDTASNSYNRQCLPQGITLLPGYGRLQGIVFRRGDPRFAGTVAREMMARMLEAAMADPDDAPVMIHRNRGSGTRILLDELLGETRPPGFSVEARSHHGVAAAVAQGRADWGVAIAPVASLHGLGFLPLKEERLDFAVDPERLRRPAVAAFAEALADPAVRARLREAGFTA
ncbi:MAG: molybdopterin biosynthesis protein [Acidobacteria bacterium]|nr:MAG: molybdopterin biosynthesis protein [Acidobacteriota bacterium]